MHIYIYNINKIFVRRQWVKLCKRNIKLVQNVFIVNIDLPTETPVQKPVSLSFQNKKIFT